MTDPTTTNLVLAVPTRGSDAGTWDTPVNGDMLIIDACAGNVTTKSVSNVTITLTATESQVNILRLTGTLTSNVVLVLGAIIKSWTVENLALGNFFIQVTGSPGTGNRVGLPPGSCQIYWDGTNCNFVNLDKIGAYWDYAGDDVPKWVLASSVPPYLLCDGSAFSGSTYPLLAAIMGSTTLPDHRGRVRFPLNGGTSRVTAAGGIDGDVRFGGGGNQVITLTTAQLPAHSHGVTDPTHSHLVNDAIGKIGTFTGNGSNGWAGNQSVASGLASTGITIQNTGSDNFHSNLQPGLVCGVTMIRAG